MTLTPEKLDEIERGLAGVTPGPWVHYRNRLRPNFGSIINEVQTKRRGNKPIVAWGGFDANDRKERCNAINAAHIARLDPQTIAELVRGYRIALDLEQGREVYVRGVRVHVPKGEQGDF